MNSSVKDLFDYKIGAQDGEIGSVQDLLFSDRSWHLRYFIVNTGGWLLGRKILVAHYAAKPPEESSRVLPVNLTKQQIKDGPDMDIDPPLSRDQEIAYHDFYRWPYYWGGSDIVGTATMTGVAPDAMLVGDTEILPEPSTMPPEDREFDLRSAREVLGYDVHIEGDAHAIGKAEDFLLNTSDWTIPFVAISLKDGSNDKHVLVPTRRIELGWPDKIVRMLMPMSAAWEAPNYDPSMRSDFAYLDKVMEHYSRKV